MKWPINWDIRNVFHVSLLKPFKRDPPKEPIQEEPPLFHEVEAILQPKEILQHEKNILCHNKIVHRYFVKFKHYTNDVSKLM